MSGAAGADRTGAVGIGTPQPRLFWTLTLASALSKLGNQFLLVSVPILLFRFTGSAAVAVLTAAAQNAPYLLAPAVGPLVDRLSRKRLFIVSELVSAVAVSLIPLVVRSPLAPLPLVYMMVFVVGCAAVVSSLTNDFTFIPSLLGDGDEQVHRAYSLYNSVLDLARFAGPASAGLLIAWADPAVALWVDAVSFLGTALAATRLADDRKHAVAAEPLRRSFQLGWSRFRAIPTLPALTGVLSVYNLGVGSIAVFVVAVAIGPWHWQSAVVGMVVSLGSLASAAGSWSGSRLFRRTLVDGRIRIWLTLSALAGLPMVSGRHAAIVGSFIAMSFCAGAFNVQTLTYRRRIIPDEFAGRVNSIVRSFVAGAVPISSVILAVGADSTDVVRFAPVVASACLAAVAWTLVLRRRPEPAASWPR